MRLLKALRALLLTALLAAFVFLLVVPAAWVYTAKNLTNPIESAMDVEMHLRKNIESERQSIEGRKPLRDRKPTDWALPDLEKLPKNLVALYLLESGCPDYLKSPQETGTPWTVRVLKQLVGEQVGGDGGCELTFAQRVARRLEASSPLDLAVAADRVHRFLSKEELVAFDLASTQHQRGLIGIEAASQHLLQKKVEELSLAETAELIIGVPPDNFWDDVEACKIASLIKQARDNVLTRAAHEGVLTEQAARIATGQPVRCMSVRR